MSLTEQLDRLAAFEPAPYPVVSLYLDTRPNQHGRDQHQAFTRKELKARSRTYPVNTPERESLDSDIERIVRFRVLGRRSVRDDSVAGRRSTARSSHRRSSTPVSACAARVAVPSVCRRRHRHEHRPHSGHLGW